MPALTHDQINTYNHNLAQFSGSEHWYKHALSRFTYTDGVRYVAQTLGAYWLLDLILLSQLERTIRKQPFQVWKLKVNLEKRTAVLTCDNGNHRIVFTKQVEFTDCPVETVEMWFENEVLYLPSER